MHKGRLPKKRQDGVEHNPVFPWIAIKLRSLKHISPFMFLNFLVLVIEKFKYFKGIDDRIHCLLISNFGDC